MVDCPTCGDDYDSIGMHFAKSDCPYPEFTERQREIIDGMMLGDGFINCRSTGCTNANPFFAVAMTNYDFLEWLAGEFDPFHSGVNTTTGSKKSKKTYYEFRTMRNPNLEDYASWYDSGSLQLNEIDLTPLAMKMWYVSDGTKVTDRTSNVRPRVCFATKYVTGSEDYFEALFDDWPVEPTVMNSELRFGVDDSERLWDIMGESPPGFEYKWPDK